MKKKYLPSGQANFVTSLAWRGRQGGSAHTWAVACAAGKEDEE